MTRSPDSRISSASPRLRGAFDLTRVRALPTSFYNRDPRIVGRELLGKNIVRRRGRSLMAGRIVETEAYLGTDDPAAHSASGPTARNRVLFGPPGRAYVYFIYGNHYCLNVSCLPDGEAGGILFRALEPVEGLTAMARNRDLDLRELQTPRQLRLLTSGPGRLCEALDITRARDNDKDFTDSSSDLWIGDDGFLPPKIVETARIGITKAVDHPLRYVIAGNEFVSGRN